MRQEELQDNIQDLTTKQILLNNLIKATKPNANTSNDDLNLKRLKAEVASTQQKIVGINKDIKEIEGYKVN